MRVLILLSLIVGVFSKCPETPMEAMQVVNGAELMDCVGTELAYLFIESGCCKPPEDKVRSKRCHNMGAAAYLRDIDLKRTVILKIKMNYKGTCVLFK